MSIKVTTKMNIGQILMRRGLGDSKDARKYLAARVKARSDPYVPMRNGKLKDTAQISESGSYLIYRQPYARYQYYGRVMGPNVRTSEGWRSMAKKGGKYLTGRDLKYNGSPMRGAMWNQRMLEANAKDLERDVQAFITRRLQK